MSKAFCFYVQGVPVILTNGAGQSSCIGLQGIILSGAAVLSYCTRDCLAGCVLSGICSAYTGLGAGS